MQGEIHCEQPNASLYTFTGNIILQRGHARSNTIALSPASILLRGSSLRNTKSILGLVIFAGHETKVMRLSPHPPHSPFCVQIQSDIFRTWQEKA